MSVTFKAVLFDHHRKEDGTNFFRIRVTHQRKTRYIKTNICVLPEDYTRTGNVNLPDVERDAYAEIVDCLPSLALTAAANKEKTVPAAVE